MKSLTILFAGTEPGHNFDKVFDEKSSFDLCCNWARSLKSSEKTVILTGKKAGEEVKKAIAGNDSFSIISKDEWTNSDIAGAVAEETSKAGADFAIYAWADTPFINNSLTEQLIHDHVEYKAEYTFADGFAAGLSPEIIHRGAASIISALSKDVQKAQGQKTASRDCFFSIMSGDINSFEIETVLADKDYRMLRYNFECSSKSGLIACKALFEKAKNLDSGLKTLNEFDVYKLSDAAEKMTEIQQTVPHFYNIQITSAENTKSLYSGFQKLFPQSKPEDMKLESFKKLVKDISDFSETAVVSLSLFGEPLLHKDFVQMAKEVLSVKGLSLFVETDGICVTEEMARELSEAGKIDWVIRLDAVDGDMYSKINGISGENFAKALNAVNILEKYFPETVYPQFTRMKVNEIQLESFFRFWKEKENPSKGQFIIMKYDSFAGLLPDEKPADLSPLERNSCWHLRRDMNILSDGSVPLCRTRVSEKAGNVFEDSLDSIWKNISKEVEKHINSDYCSVCKGCDEYYTFNF